MITTLLVANRGEIARRVFHTCRTLGIATVAVYSDADANAPHVREADTAVRLPGVSPADTYLRSDLLINAALEAGADAVHPGYGFLSENAEFARAVIAAGLTWVGPPPEAVEQMGSKIESKRLMAEAGVPVLSELDPATLTEADLPVLVKASAGGGGRGMRVVRSLDGLASQLAGARSEALSAFGDDTVFVEPYLATGRHIEVQVLCDEHGTVWAVGERECSIQRRHQKIVEESPSPLVARVPGMREELFTAARHAAKAIGYVGAGTVEFLADERGRFYFLEMNTRLQVEHPVTECVTGLDLVGSQLGVAEGRPLPAEPPPSHVAARALAAALTRSKIHGVTTNRDLLVRVLTHPAFLAGETDTAFFDRHGLPELSKPLVDNHSALLSVVAAALADAAANRERARVLGRIPSGWRNVAGQPQVKRYRAGEVEHEVRYRLGRDGLVVEGMADLTVVAARPDAVTLSVGGLLRRFDIAVHDGLSCVDSPLGSIALTPVPRFADPATQVAAGSLLAPMPGTVVRVVVEQGDRVSAGQPMLWLEAMKMQHQINAPTDGIVTELAVTEGDQVEVNRVLAVVSPTTAKKEEEP
jgi:propionyl-CoA carboxylase alpha chain